MKLNDRPYDAYQPGMTVQDVIDERNFIYPKLVVKVLYHYKEVRTEL